MGAEIWITKLRETNNSKRAQPKLKLPYLPKNPRLCVASVLQDYSEETENFKGATKNLFTSKESVKSVHAVVIT